MPPPLALRPGPAMGKPAWLERIRLPQRGGGPPVTTHAFGQTAVLTVGGTAPSRPRFTFRYPEGTDYGISAIGILNVSLTPDQGITVTRTFVPGDTLVIDSDLYIVTVNDVAVDFAGSFPVLDPRVGTTNTILISVLALYPPTLPPQFDWTPRYLS